jgi:hypothetical protein
MNSLCMCPCVSSWFAADDSTSSNLKRQRRERADVKIRKLMHTGENVHSANTFLFLDTAVQLQGLSALRAACINIFTI